MSQLLCDLGVATRVVRDGHILLVQEAKGRHAGRWGLPKGNVDDNESPENAALRELREETGLEGQLVGLAGVRTALQSNGPAVFLCYEATVTDDQLQTDGDEIASARWFSLDGLKSLEWVSETMHQLAVDGFCRSTVLVNQRGLTPRTNPYAVYRAAGAHGRGR
ncbi:MAG: NUDIX hydrolase [Candidatus Poseidonia sp.]|jgi:8-oxo-dGTP diphosphatase|nr:NUDIX hydrolase [Poseidonia sp.]